MCKMAIAITYQGEKWYCMRIATPAEEIKENNIKKILLVSVGKLGQSTNILLGFRGREKQKYANI